MELNVKQNYIILVVSHCNVHWHEEIQAHFVIHMNNDIWEVGVEDTDIFCNLTRMGKCTHKQRSPLRRWTEERPFMYANPNQDTN